MVFTYHFGRVFTDIFMYLLYNIRARGCDYVIVG